jgi:PAS domain S-box-containing protein
MNRTATMQPKAEAPSRAHAGRSTPRSIVVFVGALTALAGGVAAAGVQVSNNTSRPMDPQLLAFIPLLIGAESLMLRYRYRDNIDGRNLFEAVLAPLIFAYPAVAVMATVALAQAINGSFRKNQPIKAAFNVAQWTLAAGVGSLIFSELRSSTAVTPRNIMVLVVALVAVMVVNQVAFTYVIHLAQREPLRRVIRGMAPSYMVGLVAQAPVNLTVGLVLAGAYRWSSTTLFLFPLPLVGLYWMFRSHSIAITERSRVSGLRSAIKALGDHQGDGAIPRFLAHVRDAFEAEAVDLVLTETRGRLVHRLEVGEPPPYDCWREFSDQVTLAAALLGCDRPVRVTKDSAGALASFLRAEGWRDCYAAPLLIGGRVNGVIAIYNRTGFDGLDDAELTLLESLAGETASMRKSEALEASLRDQSRFGDMVTRTTDGLLGVNVDGMVKMWNPALEHITGYSAEEMIDTRQMGILRPRDDAGNDVMIEHWARTDVAPPDSVQIRTRSGEVRWLSCSHTVLPSSDRQPAMLIMVARDVTQTREVERLKEDFAASVSHELRAPLTPIKGWAATLLENGNRVTEAERETGVRSILRQAEHLEEIISGLLDVAKIDGGKTRRTEAVDIRALLDRVSDEVRSAYPGRAVQLFYEAGSYRPQGNEAWIGQIVRNLLTNAMKYSPSGRPVDVNIACASGKVTIKVIDHGSGIAPEDQSLIFERFHRLAHNSPGADGVGLGLYIASQLARAMGGSLAVESELGRGAAFILTLPAVVTLSIVG